MLLLSHELFVLDKHTSDVCGRPVTSGHYTSRGNAAIDTRRVLFQQRCDYCKK